MTDTTVKPGKMVKAVKSPEHRNSWAKIMGTLRTVLMALGALVLLLLLGGFMVRWLIP